MHVINRFKHYIIGYEFFIHNSHSTIRYLMKSHITSDIITWCIFLLQVFNIAILDIPRKANLIVDFLSNIHNEGLEDPLDDDFPD